MKLQSLEITNFRGIDSLTIDALGRSVKITGDNGCGKSTVKEAFLWLLTGKDGFGRSNYNIRPIRDTALALSAENISSRDVAVSATMRVRGGREIQLTRMLRAKLEGVGTGKKYNGQNVTMLYVDGKKMTGSEFSRFVQDLTTRSADISAVIDLYYITERMKDEERRELLLRTFGGMTEEEFAVCSGDPEYKEIMDMLLPGESVPDFTKKLSDDLNKTAAKYKTAAAELEALREKADAAQKYGNAKQLERSVRDLTRRKTELETEKQRRLAGGVGKRKAELEEEKERINLEIKNFIEREAAKKAEELRAQAETLRKKRSEQIRKLDEIAKEKEKLRDRYVELRVQAENVNERLEESRTKTFSKDGVCPACGQEIPKESIEKEREAFNLEKAEREERLTIAAEQIETEKRAISKKLREIAEEQEKCLNKRDELELKITDAARKEREALENKRDVAPSAERTQRLAKLEAEISKLGTEEAADTGDIDAEIHKTEEAIEKLNEAWIEASKVKTLDSKITELEKSIETLTEREAEYMRFFEAGKRFGCGKAKAEEERINSSFKNTEWKLYDTYQNGNIKNVCEAYVGKVKYGSVNRAGRAAASLDVITAVSKKLRVELPIFIDDMDGVFLPDVYSGGAQVITMEAKREFCPECGGESGLREEDGMWTCASCGHRWKKELKIEYV